MATWGFDNISFHLTTQIWQSLITHNAPGWFFLCILAITLCYPLVHSILLQNSRIYSEQLSPEQRVVVLQHAIEAVTLSVLFLPFTYTVIAIFFQEQTLQGFADKLVALGVFMAVVMTMYMFEIATRFASLRPLVVAHHLCAYLDGILTAFFLGTANIKAAFLLVYFITYEALTFFGLVMYRLAPTHRLTCPTILAGMAVFGLSRPIQLVWVIGSLLATGIDNLVIWQVALQIALTVSFTGLQLYSLTIHKRLYHKAYRKRKEMLEGEESDDPGDKRNSTAASEASSRCNTSDLEP